MKLYEFTFNDNTNLSESKVLEVALLSLQEEALLQGWATGYNLQQRQKPQQLANGEMEYYFEVEGEYQTDGQSGEGQEKSKSASPKPDVAASP